MLITIEERNAPMLDRAKISQDLAEKNINPVFLDVDIQGYKKIVDQLYKTKCLREVYEQTWEKMNKDSQTVLEYAKNPTITRSLFIWYNYLPILDHIEKMRVKIGGIYSMSTPTPIIPHLSIFIHLGEKERSGLTKLELRKLLENSSGYTNAMGYLGRLKSHRAKATLVRPEMIGKEIHRSWSSRYKPVDRDY